MGNVTVPVEAYYGSQTQRAIDNFQFSSLRFSDYFLKMLAMIKKAAIQTNFELSAIDQERSTAMIQAANEIIKGEFADQFPVDLFQTGSGTSTNMNMNEVIASRANELMTGRKGGRDPVHPNDHVNKGQSSNDVIPTAIHLTALRLVHQKLIPALRILLASLNKKASEFERISKIGRTHLQDAVPMTLGQEFSGYARQVELGIKRIRVASENLTELAIGGTAVGTGVNAHPQFAIKVVQALSQETGLSLSVTKNHFEAQAAKDAVVELSGALKTYAVSLSKIANDIRWLSSGPRCGLSEIRLPELQPGSSIMPGKVNPVIPEAVLQIAAQVIGNDTTITFAGQSGNFELNVMMPVIAHNLIQSIELLGSASQQFAARCIDGVAENHDTISAYVERSLAMATLLVPVIGYDEAARIAKKAASSGKSVREIAEDEGIPFPARENPS